MLPRRSYRPRQYWAAVWAAVQPLRVPYIDRSPGLPVCIARGGDPGGQRAREGSRRWTSLPDYRPWRDRQQRRRFRPVRRSVSGSAGHYRALAAGPGELAYPAPQFAPDSAAPSRRRSLLSFAQITDIHIQDQQSPGRFEFANRFTGPAPMHLLIPPTVRRSFCSPTP